MDPNDPANQSDGFPLFPDADPTVFMGRMLATAISTRAGVAVVGDKGVGKTLSLERVVDDFNTREIEASLDNPSYTPQRVLNVGRIKAETERHCFIDLLTAIRKSPPSVRARGGPKTNKQLLDEALSLCFEENIVAFAVEEGEFATEAALTVLRDLMTDAAQKDTRRAATNVGGAQRGIGILLAGTTSLRWKIEQSDEVHHRWVLIEEIGNVPPSLVPEIYLYWFPAFQTHVDSIGAARWATYIATTITKGRPIAIGILIRHAQLYLEALRGTGAPIPRTQAPFDKEKFEGTWRRFFGGGDN